MIPDWLQAAAREGRVTGLEEPADKRHGGRLHHTRGAPNRTEQRYADEVLEPMKQGGEILDYWYEPITLKLAFDTRLTVDWVVLAGKMGKWLNLELIDVKGTRKDGKPQIEEDANVKLKVAAHAFPFPIAIVWEKLDKSGWNRRIVPGGKKESTDATQAMQGMRVVEAPKEPHKNHGRRNARAETL